MSAHVVVIGSLNVDLVVTADRLPLPGETVLGGQFGTHDGGKGANQAVAAARVGARVSMIGAVGADAHGERAVASLAAEGIDTSRIRRLEAEATGVAIIAVGPRGENQIVVAPGANALLELDDDDRALIGVRERGADQPRDSRGATIDALRTAHAAGITAILNPAPARALPSEILSLGPILTPNEHELVVAIGNDVTDTALDELAARHQGPIIVTQGPAGALLAEGDAARSVRRPAGAERGRHDRGRRHVLRRPRRLARRGSPAGRGDRRRQRCRRPVGRAPSAPGPGCPPGRRSRPSCRNPASSRSTSTIGSRHTTCLAIARQPTAISGGSMDAIALLKADHDKVKKMLAEGEETTERAEKTRTELFDTLKSEMLIHERIEEEIFYPALKSHPKARDIVLEGYEEHHVVDEIMGELEATAVTDETWGAKFKVMKENIEHHIEEEEGDMFKQARQIFDADELEELGARMLELKQLGQQVEAGA